MDGMSVPDVVDGDAEEIEIRRNTMQIEQKRIFLNLRENARGRYLRIVEVTGNNRSTIIVPASGLQQFRAILDEFVDEAALGQGHQGILAVSSNGVSDGKKKKRRNKKPAAAGDGGAVGPAGVGLPAAGATGAEGPSPTRVFVGNLAWSTNSQGLLEHFTQCGQIVRADVFTERSGRSRGCGTVEFATEAEARGAMDSMTGTTLDGRTIFVREDRL
mmetsp:Transcript_47629/g.126300  ORF Transcript_47629/g.126300 Transcript_47629/m.126300 type:complete len:216 (-) Transcript_47629:61-708(-)